ncbi:unnamed protein product [Rotaria magnacalcarata]|uniref:1-phosphatidylinositol-5-phosphate 4-kinase n=2 Tax=Rotaria magnacalcarata TaxID=392030 RepID=A0A815G290_9BILA|nr:unnamed protein product [Rotaria magnacalcarata]CAF1333346.1 unnamed protein product [Rotaria magnacalcarata]CAF2031698.1 unnamed protein product [Rotaria magnacalcarata]CAF2165461.1 unnamed protein product [Rotaria magnacalcarata]CAF2197918.1 unnamed protein product [Rotaria magnacalcarata]
MEGRKIKTKSKLKVHRQKHKLFRANDPLLSVLMWGVNFTTHELENANIPIMLLPEHFKAYVKVRVDNQNFNKEVMPSHFKIKEYCPLVFRAIRKHWQINDSNFRNSLTEPSILLNESAEANTNYYQSCDRRFIIKCISREAVEQISNILPEYHRYIVESQGDTLLPHYCAMYRLTVDDKENYILVMRNIFSSKLKIHFKYDVKGSTFGRSATDKKKLNSCPTLKDTEFLENKCIIDIGPEQKLIFMERLKRDVQFLVDQHKIDYSLSIGIHDLDQDDIERHKRASVVDMNISDSSSFDYSDGSESPTRMDDSNVFDEPFHMRSSELSTRRESYNIGFADILTHYNRRKKSVILTRRRLSTSDADETLIVQPELYARRFLDFIDKHCI